MKRICGPMLGAFVGATCLALLPFVGLVAQAFAHGVHEHAADEPGDPKKPFRTVKVTMLEDGKKMPFEPAVVDVRLGEQFVLRSTMKEPGIMNSCWRPKKPIESTPN